VVSTAGTAVSASTPQHAVAAATHGHRRGPPLTEALAAD
jgi:hypothetical protein